MVGLEVENALLQAGFQVLGVAGTAEEAIDAARSANPTLVIMDIRLRGRRDGVDAAIEIYRSTGIRSIFATAHQDQLVRQRAEAARPLGWLSKPYAVGVLVKLVRDTLASSEG